MPRFNAWIVATAVLVAFLWLSPEEFDPDAIRRKVSESAARVSRSMSHIVASLFSDGLKVAPQESGKPVEAERAADAQATENDSSATHHRAR